MKGSHVSYTSDCDSEAWFGLKGRNTVGWRRAKKWREIRKVKWGLTVDPNSTLLLMKHHSSSSLMRTAQKEFVSRRFVSAPLEYNFLHLVEEQNNCGMYKTPAFTSAKGLLRIQSCKQQTHTLLLQNTTASKELYIDIHYEHAFFFYMFVLSGSKRNIFSTRKQIPLFKRSVRYVLSSSVCKCRRAQSWGP